MNPLPTHPRPRSPLPWLLAVLLAAAPTPGLRAACPVEPMTLRVEDATAVPGGVLAVVLRTYSPRGVGQGQVCLRQPLEGQAPLAELLDFEVFSTAGDATAQAEFDAGAQTLLLQFSSPSAGINEEDGPLAVLYFRLAEPLAPGASFSLLVDLGDTALFDGDGVPIPLEPRAGDMQVRDPAAPFALEAEGGEVAAGGLVEAGAGTEESLPLSAGRVAFHYDPALVRGLPAVSMDPRYGAARYLVEHPQPGLVRVTFESLDGSLGRLPGQFLTVRLPVAVGLPAGLASTVSLDAADTWLVDAAGRNVDLALDTDVVELVPDTPLLADGFESGDLAAWCRVFP